MTMKNLDAKALKELGVDFRVTKKELIDLVVEEQRENIEAEVAANNEAYKTIRDNLYPDAEVLKHVAALDLPKHVLSFIKKKGVSTRINVANNCGYHGETPGDVKADVDFYTSDKGYKASVTVFLKVPENTAGAKEMKQLREEGRVLRDQLNQLHHGSKKMQRELVRTILGSSEGGKQLVATLDGYRANKALPTGKK